MQCFWVASKSCVVDFARSSPIACIRHCFPAKANITTPSTMRLLAPFLIAIVAVAPMPAFAADAFCKRLPVDPEVPAGLAGSYDVVGQRSDGPAYSGTLTLGFGKSRYRVVQTVQGRSTYELLGFPNAERTGRES